MFCVCWCTGSLCNWVTSPVCCLAYFLFAFFQLYNRYERHKLADLCPEGVSASPDDDNIFAWTASIFDNLGPYEGGYVIVALSPLWSRSSFRQNMSLWQVVGIFYKCMHVCRFDVVFALVWYQILGYKRGGSFVANTWLLTLDRSSVVLVVSLILPMVHVYVANCGYFPQAHVFFFPWCLRQIFVC